MPKKIKKKKIQISFVHVNAIYHVSRPVKTIFIVTVVKVFITYFPCCNLMMFHFCLSAKRLAFSASFLALTPGDFGPFNTHTTLVFRHVVTNIGSAYNPHTGAAIYSLYFAFTCAHNRNIL